MSKRKSKGKSKGKSQLSRSEAPDFPFPFPFEADVMSYFMDQLFDEWEMSADEEEERKALTKDKKCPLAKAQKLIYKATDSYDPDEQERYARQALKACPDCADAYILLAGQANSDDEAIGWYRDGMLAGERALGKPFIDANAGQFWSIMKTRPYMRARLGLALQLWQAGQHEECLDHLRDLLRLNAQDDQGIRYYLASYLLQLGRDQELSDLLQKRDEPSTDWLYHKALLAFRQEGDTPHSRDVLQYAAKFNPHVAVYMADFRPLPMVLPEFTQSGDEGEAIHYTANNRAGWKTTAGAIPWLRKVLNPEFPPEELEKIQPLRPKPHKVDMDELAALPQSDEVWQVDQVCAPIILDEDDSEEAERLDQWIWIVAAVDEENLIDHELLDDKLSAAEAFERLCRLMVLPQEQEPSRPARIETRVKSFAKSWTPKLKRIGIACVLVNKLEVTDDFVEQMNSFVADSEGRMGAAPTMDELLQLPLERETVYQVDCRQLPTWIQETGEPQRPWMLLVANRTDGTIAGQHLSPEPPSDDEIWRTLACSLARPLIGEPQRPGRLELSSPGLRASLLPHLERLGIQCAVRDNLDQMDFLFQDIGRNLSGKSSIPSIMGSPGITTEQVGDYFTAAAEYFRRAPWRKVRGDAAIKLECPKYQNCTWYAVVMGQSGITLGLALYENREVLDEILYGPTSEEEPTVTKMTGLSLVYGEAFEMSPIDVEACERYGWPLATTEAYPHAMWLNPGMVIRTPLAWELELLTGALRAIPDFLESKSKSAKTVKASTVSGNLEFNLSWLDD